MRWKNGVSSNVVAKDSIELPSYTLPTLFNQSTTQSWYKKNLAQYSIPTTPTTYGDTTVLDHSSNNTSGTAFTNTVSDGNVYTTVSSASSRTSTISLTGIKPGRHSKYMAKQSLVVQHHILKWCSLAQTRHTRKTSSMTRMASMLLRQSM